MSEEIKVNIAKVKRLTPTAHLPTYGTEYAACMDLYADCPDAKSTLWELDDNGMPFISEIDGIIIEPQTSQIIHTGLAFEPQIGYNGYIFARSGKANKEHLRLSNCVGKCDWDYRGEYLISLYNDSNEPRIVHHGDRIAQLEFIPYEHTKLVEVDELSETVRGDGSFGHTGG